jgi:hypothetical protein
MVQQLLSQLSFPSTSFAGTLPENFFSFHVSSGSDVAGIYSTSSSHFDIIGEGFLSIRVIQRWIVRNANSPKNILAFEKDFVNLL